MHFGTRSYLKSTRNYTAKHAQVTSGNLFVHDYEISHETFWPVTEWRVVLNYFAHIYLDMRIFTYFH
jgi:hypothetical protein